MLEKIYKPTFDNCMEQCNQEFLALDAHIANLALSINQIPPIDPPEEERNRGMQHVMYVRPTVTTL